MQNIDTNIKFDKEPGMFDPVSVAEELIRHRVSPEEAAELIVDAIDSGYLTYTQGSSVLQRVGS